MKRLHKKQLDISLFTTHKIYSVSNKHSKNVYCYFTCDASSFSKLLMEKIEAFKLPLMDVYTIYANSYDGIKVGYAFDCYGKNVKYLHNFLLSTNLEFSDFMVKQLNPKSFGLKYKIDDIFFHSYEGMGSMVTLGLSEKSKEALDI